MVSLNLLTQIIIQKHVIINIPNIEIEIFHVTQIIKKSWNYLLLDILKNNKNA
jgi:hypothetical protein